MNIFVDVDVFTNEHIHVIDVRKKEEYDQGHIPGALFLDVKHDLSGENTFFPTPEILGEKLGQLGISEDSRVVIYDSGTQRRAAKAWVTLYYIGHHTIHILQGGYPHWENKGKHNLVGQSVRLPTTYHVNVRNDVALDIEQVKNRMNDQHSTLIDSRSNERYTGEHEPRYKKAGHIPGAKNYYSANVFNEHGMWKDELALKQHFAPLNDNKETIVSCGTGTSACLNFVALKEAGFKDVKIYPGGFKEWIDHNYNIETSNENNDSM